MLVPPPPQNHFPLSPEHDLAEHLGFSKCYSLWRGLPLTEAHYSKTLQIVSVYVAALRLELGSLHLGMDFLNNYSSTHSLKVSCAKPEQIRKKQTVSWAVAQQK